MYDPNKRHEQMSAPTTISQSNNNSENIGFVKSYPLSISGLLRIGLIVFQKGK